MLHDPVLVEKLSKFERTSFEGTVYRATGKSADPLAASSTGGRWAMSVAEDGGFPILYASLEKDGAVAEIASYLMLLDPMPRKPIMLHELAVSTSHTLRLLRGDLTDLGVDMAKYGERNYKQTQIIGAVINFLNCDGLIAPSARWSCENLMIFPENHGLQDKLETVQSEETDWVVWSKNVGLLEQE